MESIIQGTIIHGDHQGSLIGFPTANLDTDENNIQPAIGIYHGLVVFKNGIKHKCAVVIRNRKDGKSVEFHIPNFNQDIYGETVILSIKNSIREWEDFKNSEELKKQITKDIQAVIVSEL